ncbi:MAG: hypothetical protein ACSHX6_02850 [Akkermansiaceae bacterium]
MKSLLIPTIFLLLIKLGCSANPMVIKPLVIKAAYVDVAKSSVSPKDSFHHPGKKLISRTVRLTNTTKRDLYVHGYSLKYVFVEVYTRKNSKEKWVSQNLGYSGTGAGDHKFKTGESFTVIVNLPQELSDHEFMVGFYDYSPLKGDELIEVRSPPLNMLTKPNKNAEPQR